MNLQTNLLTNITPQTWEKRTEREWEMESRRKGADSSDVFAVCLSKHVPKSSKHAQEYGEEARDSEE